MPVNDTHLHRRQVAAPEIAHDGAERDAGIVRIRCVEERGRMLAEIPRGGLAGDGSQTVSHRASVVHYDVLFSVWATWVLGGCHILWEERRRRFRCESC